MLEPLVAHIQKLAPLILADQALLRHYFEYKVISKKQYLLTEGDLCKAQYFVIEGCLRIFLSRKAVLNKLFSSVLTIGG